MSFAVPRYGLIGAAGAMLLGYSSSLLFAASARRALGIPPAQRRGRFWLGLVIGCITQTALVVAFGPRITGWLGLLALAAAAWASFYLVRAIVAMLTPEEDQLLQRFSEATRQWLKRRSERRTPR